jgi:hypothetical protein
VDVFKLACQAMIDMDLRPLLPKITAPTLVIETNRSKRSFVRWLRAPRLR